MFKASQHSNAEALLKPGIRPCNMIFNWLLRNFDSSLCEWPTFFQATMISVREKKKKKKNLNIDNCLECFCLKVMRPTRSNQDRGEKERVTDEGVWIYHSPMLTFIHRDRRRGIMTSVRKKKAERLFKLKGRGDGRRENGGLRRSQGQEIVWERSRVKVELTCLSIGVH